MALVRILVDGYNLIAFMQSSPDFGEGCGSSRRNNGTKLALRAPLHSERARDALVEMLQQYQDACGTPITVFFDGTGARKKLKSERSGAVEVLFSSGGQTADDLIERAAHRFQDYGEVLVVSDDYAVRDTVGAFNGSVASCANFVRMMGQARSDLQEDLDRHNRSARGAFRHSH